VDRDDGRDNPPLGGLGSFDISKRGGREIAADLAAHMARWRNARKRSDAPARGPPASAAVAEPAVPGLPAVPPPSADRASPPTGLDAIRAARIHRALRVALQTRAPQTEDVRTRPTSQTRSHGAAFKTVLADGPNMNAIGMRPERRLAAQAAGATAWRALRRAFAQCFDAVHRRIRAVALAADRIVLAAWRSLSMALRNRLDRAPLHARALQAAVQRLNITGWRAPRPSLGHRIDQALRHARAIGAAAWHVISDRLVIAGAAAIAVAIAGWFLVPSDRPASPDAPRQPDVASPRDDVGAPAVHPPEPSQASAAASAPPSQASAAASAPPSQAIAAAFPPAPQERAPDTASARLPARLKPVLQAPALATRLKPPVPEAPAADPVNSAPPASQSQEATDTPRGRGDPRVLDSMVSDGHGLSRRDDSAARTTLLR
jgi:hypothetical protein